MTLDEAIYRQNLIAGLEVLKGEEKFQKAISLGIEALKREQEHRELDIDTRFGLLPGETEE